MITGYNANIPHGDRVFHVQTEDSGRAHPHVITLLYFEGSILASERSDYAEIVDALDLVPRVRQLMEDQHAMVVDRLRRGHYDAVIAARFSGPSRIASELVPEIATPAATPVPRSLRAVPAPQRGAPRPDPDRPSAGPSEAARAFGDGIVSERPLDDVILEYLVAKSRERSGGGRGSRSEG
ncbi:MAG: hypothetical protein E4H11_02065 [Myxococcales bacterium]|nr:MAG: hypothetical protein E4H11_02065 [Myxococcales bacterium]